MLVLLFSSFEMSVRLLLWIFGSEASSLIAARGFLLREVWSGRSNAALKKSDQISEILGSASGIR